MFSRVQFNICCFPCGLASISLYEDADTGEQDIIAEIFCHDNFSN
jgi:hypothetical protein